MSLFRKEAVAYQGERLTGPVILVQPLSIKLTSMVLILACCLVITFLVCAEYTRKETVRGFLVPDKGVIKSFTSASGTIEKIWVKEGDVVRKGDPLVTLVSQENDLNGISYGEGLAIKISSQIDLIEKEIGQHRHIEKKEIENLKLKELAVGEEIGTLKSQLSYLSQKIDLLTSQQVGVDKLSRDGFVSRFETEGRRNIILEVRRDKQEVERILLQQQNRLVQINFEMENLPKQYSLKVSALLRDRSQLESRLTQIKNDHIRVIPAQHSGVVTSIQVVEGETLSYSKAQSKPLLHLFPEGAKLVAELLLPTRSAGFVSVGQRSKIRFDAFPYQRFGFVEGEISAVDGTLVAPSEASLPVGLSEPVYRLTAKLEKQEISAYGKSFLLKSGMLFEADIMLDKRPLIEWLLEPIYSLKGKIH